MTDSSDQAEVIAALTIELGGIPPSYTIRNRPDGKYIAFEFVEPSDRFYEALEKVNDSLVDDHRYKDKTAIVRRTKRPSNVLSIPETALLQRELSESLTVDRNTFGNDFLNRYTRSVTNLEKNVVVHANHIVYGRRGSGKSSLLAYAMHLLKNESSPFAWVAMQTYASRNDKQAIASVLSEIFSELATKVGASTEYLDLATELMKLGESENEQQVEVRVGRLIPRMRLMLSNVLSPGKVLTIFLDDLHVLGPRLQPELLSTLYSLTRGNRAYLKISGIEQLTNLWDGALQRGLQAPHDIQTLMLDHNLTNPDQSKDHISNILDRHAKYCGIPSVQYIAADNFLDRLVLSAAAVPRDALSLFSKSIARSLMKGQKAVSITSLNAATSEAIEEKLKDVERDAFGQDKEQVPNYLSQVKKFCLEQEKKNAFLVKIENGSASYANVQRLVALRFVHVLHEGITPHKAGVRFMALMLDYGFYIGIRAARSIELFPDEPRQLAAKELRKLPIFSPNLK